MKSFKLGFASALVAASLSLAPMTAMATDGGSPIDTVVEIVAVIQSIVVEKNELVTVEDTLNGLDVSQLHFLNVDNCVSILEGGLVKTAAIANGNEINALQGLVGDLYVKDNDVDVDIHDVFADNDTSITELIGVDVNAIAHDITFLVSKKYCK